MANTSTSVPKSTIPSPKPIITMVVFMLGWLIWDKFVALTIIHLIVWGYYLIIRNEEDDDYDDLTSLATQKWDAHEAEQWENTQRNYAIFLVTSIGLAVCRHPITKNHRASLVFS